MTKCSNQLLPDTDMQDGKDALTTPIRAVYTHESEPVETNLEELQGFFEIFAEIALAVAERNLAKVKVN